MSRDDLQPLFEESLHVANRMLGSGATSDALTVLTLLAGNERFGDVRSIACVNCAIVAGNLGRVDDAIAWLDRGIALEAPRPTRIAARHKAGLLVQVGREEQALALYLELLAGPISEQDAEAIHAALAALDARPSA
jgi:tetratricopeptide (TPR) repeat protein